MLIFWSIIAATVNSTTELYQLKPVNKNKLTIFSLLNYLPWRLFEKLIVQTALN